MKSPAVIAQYARRGAVRQREKTPEEVAAERATRSITAD